MRHLRISVALLALAFAATPSPAQQAPPPASGSVASTSPINHTVTIRISGTFPTSIVKGSPVLLSIPALSVGPAPVQHDTVTVYKTDTLRIPVPVKDSAPPVTQPPDPPLAVTTLTGTLTAVTLANNGTTAILSVAVPVASTFRAIDAQAYNGATLTASSPGIPSSTGVVTSASVGESVLAVVLRVDGITLSQTQADQIAAARLPTTLTPVASAPPAQSPPIDPSTVLASANFDDGTYGGMTNDVPGHNSIVTDPLNAGHGKVLQIKYGCGGAEPACQYPIDLNQYINYLPKNGGVAHGQSICVNADFAFPANTPRFADGAILRKLTYYWLTGDIASAVIGSGGTNANHYGTTIQNAQGGDVVTYGKFTIQPGVWYHLQNQITMNSAPGKTDGAFKVWVNGQLVDNLTNVGFTRSGQSANLKMSSLRFGYQREGVPPETVLEYHLWDNFVFSTSCAN